MAINKPDIRRMLAPKISPTLPAVLLLLSLHGTILPTGPVAAVPDEVKWSRVNTPTEGEAGNWVLASGSDVSHLKMTADGTIYGYANPAGTSYTLFKSTDTGNSWSHTGQVEGAIVGIATAPDDADIVYYATATGVYKSDDAGKSFTPLPSDPGGAGSNNITITSIAVARRDGDSIVAVGTADSDDSQYGGVYILDESKPLTGWIDTQAGSYDVKAIAFSPDYASDRQLVAAVTDEQNTIITTRIDDAGWGDTTGDAVIEGLAPVSASIAFPDSYGIDPEECILFIAIDTGSNDGDVYMVSGAWAPGSSLAVDLDIGAAYGIDNIDVAGLAISGDAANASLLAGAASSTEVYISTDSGSSWERSRKEPTGQSETCLLMAPDFTVSGKAFAATSGTGSAFSCTTDGGVTWSQISLIDTAITTIVDLSPSPAYSQDGTLFMLTWGGEHDLWRSSDSGERWERILTTLQDNIDEITLVTLPPQYGNNCQVVFLAGSSNGNPLIWKSVDNGQRFTPRSPPLPIDVWAIANENTLFLGSFDGSDGLVYVTDDGGLSYTTGTVAGSNPLKSIALSPDYVQDETILIGNTNGGVYLSSDNVTTFRPLPPDATSPLAGEITVAFDPEFSNNGVVYAASTTADEGIYRFRVNRSTIWESIDATLPSGGKVSQLAISADGTLYAANLIAGDGMERSLNPTYSLGPTFETVTRGLDDDTTLTRMWLQDNQLWSVDGHNKRLMTYIDSLTTPVTPTSPADWTSGTSTDNIHLDWETLKGATSYRWQLDYDTDFSSVPTGFEGDTGASSVRLQALEAATTYYWRVRATEPVLSPWSDKWSFTTSLGTEVIIPELYSPEASAGDTPVEPVFQWSSIAGAISYELLVSADTSFSNPVISKTGDYALPATAWQSDIILDYNTTYFWFVRI